MSFEEDNKEEAMTIDIHQKRPSHWVAEELVHQGEESFQFHRGPRVGKRESSLTLFRIVKKLFFPSKTLMKQETTLKTRETVANMLQREEDEKADDPEMITIPSSIRGDYSLLWLRNLLKEHEHESETTLDRDVVGAHVKNMCESFVYVSEDKNDPRNGGDALRESAREVLEMCCVHLGALKDINWEQFSRRLQRLMPTEQFCSKDEVLNKIKLKLFEATRRKNHAILDQKARKNSGKFKNALRQFMEGTMDKVNLELASGRATSIDQLAMHHQDGWLSMRNAHVNWNRRKGMAGMVGMRKWPKCTDVIAEEGDLDVLVGAKSDDEVEEEEEEEEEEEPRRQRQQQNELILSENRRKQPKPRKNWSVLGKRKVNDVESSEEVTEDIPMPVLPPNKGRSKSTSRGKSSNVTPMLEELANATLQAANRENQQRREPNVISQPSVRGPSKKRGGAAPLSNSPAKPTVVLKNDGFDALKKALEEREARKEAEKATAIAEERAAEAAVEEEVDDGFARLRAELEKREEEKKKQKPNRSGWAFVGKRKEPEKEEKETLDEDDEEEENDSDIIETQQIGDDDDDDEMQDADVIDSQPREESNNVVRGGFFKFFGNKTPSVAQHPVKQPSPTRSGENVRITSPREVGDDDGDDLPRMQIDDDDDDEDEPTAFNEQKIALVPMVVQQQSYQSPPKPQQPKQRVQSPPQQHQYHHHQISSPPQQAARRVTGKFSEEEVLAVIRGVEMYGLGKWKLIRESSADGVLFGRTPVDIKDKYRNLKSSDLKRVLTGIVPRSASYPFVEEHFEKVRRAAEDAN
tara:strand:- start:2861 stop:5281 length:2421 start_codon:yes stop_codon:yes gene_type:complete